MNLHDLNYRHLYYFWVVAREGTISAAAERLHLAQPTVSAQLRTLETTLGQVLFEKSGRYLRLSEAGQTVLRYADEIFSLGQEMVEALEGRPAGGELRFQVGVVDAIPKLIVHRLLQPIEQLPEAVRLTCHEGKAKDLLARLALHELDLVISDLPVAADVNVRAYSHLLGECGLTVMGIRELAVRHRQHFPARLDGAPFLLPTEDTVMRRTLSRWFEKHDIHPRIVSEFEDSALLKVFAQEGGGLVVVPSAIEEKVRGQYGLEIVGRIIDATERFYAISAERRVRHPGVSAMMDEARAHIFESG